MHDDFVCGPSVRAVSPWLTSACAHAVIQTDNSNGFAWGPMYNAYETRTTQTCSASTTGCCSSGTVLTKLLYDTSTSYTCWLPQYTTNAMQIQVSGNLPRSYIFSSACMQASGSRHIALDFSDR